MKTNAKCSPFSTFCEGPDDIESGYKLFYLFYKRNYYSLLPQDKNSKILVVSSGVGYFQYFLFQLNYSNVMGIDSDSCKVEYARKKGFISECKDCFEFLQDSGIKYDFIFCEQEINHLTRDEFKLFLELCYNNLREGGIFIVNAANSANPFIASEHMGNNIDHFTYFTENNLRQYFSMSRFRKVMVFPHDFYVLRFNPFNYVTKYIIGIIHLTLRIIFRMYGKTNKLFTKRIGAIAVK